MTRWGELDGNYDDYDDDEPEMNGFGYNPLNDKSLWTCIGSLKSCVVADDRR